MERQIKSAEKHFLFKFWLAVLISIGILKILSIILNRQAYLASLPKNVPNNYEVLSLVLNTSIVFCFIMLLKLRKWAFYGIALISFISLAISIQFEFKLISSIFIFLAFGILIAVMNIKKNNISVWQLLH